MKKIISFSLFGDDPKYLNGMLCNLELCPLIYPDWIVRIYCSSKLQPEYVNKLMGYEKTEVIVIDEQFSNILPPMTWRFLPYDDEDVKIFISRDADSRLCYREKICVDLFEKSEKLFHSIRDNANHGDTMGGLWGVKNDRKFSMRNLILESSVNDNYGSDQNFLRELVIPHFKDSILIHCSYFQKTFPIQPVNHHFVGEVFPADNYGQPYNHVFY
jgi:hypothetical protein